MAGHDSLVKELKYLCMFLCKCVRFRRECKKLIFFFRRWILSCSKSEKVMLIILKKTSNAGWKFADLWIFMVPIQCRLMPWQLFIFFDWLESNLNYRSSLYQSYWPQDLMPNNLVLETDVANRNKVYDKCNMLESSPKLPHIPVYQKLSCHEMLSWCPKGWGPLPWTTMKYICLLMGYCINPFFQPFR